MQVHKGHSAGHVVRLGGHQCGARNPARHISPGHTLSAQDAAVRHRRIPAGLRAHAEAGGAVPGAHLDFSWVWLSIK